MGGQKGSYHNHENTRQEEALESGTQDQRFNVIDKAVTSSEDKHRYNGSDVKNELICVYD